MPVYSFSTPSLAPGAWTKKIVDYGVGPVDLVSNAGTATAIYSSEDANFLHSLRYASEL
ncbi:hypothetical protein IT575_13560 [bacterium]|nr:hypothetical protein [bacterium]